MKTIVINTGTELLLGDVLNTHLAFIAREILPLGLRVDRQLTVPDGAAIREALTESFTSADIIFVTGGLGPTTDDITRELTADLLGLELRNDPNVIAAIKERFARRGYKWTSRIARQADVPIGAEVLPNENGTAPGLYFRANLNPQVRSPHLFLLPGPPRELRPMFIDFVFCHFCSASFLHPPCSNSEPIALLEWENPWWRKPSGKRFSRFRELSWAIAHVPAKWISA